MKKHAKPFALLTNTSATHGSTQTCFVCDCMHVTLNHRRAVEDEARRRFRPKRRGSKPPAAAGGHVGRNFPVRFATPGSSIWLDSCRFVLFFCATPPVIRTPHTFVCKFVPGVGGRATDVPYGESPRIISVLALYETLLSTQLTCLQLLHRLSKTLGA